MKVSIFWFRRDLRLEDNVGLYHALVAKTPVVPIFIFDTEITNDLPKDDARISFIYENLQKIDRKLKIVDSALQVYKGKPKDIWKQIISEYEVEAVYSNKDYEPYAISRDTAIKELLAKNNIECYQYKDQVIFEENEILKKDGTPYTVYTPYKNKWIEKFETTNLQDYIISNLDHKFYPIQSRFPSLKTIGFELSKIKIKDYTLENVDQYEKVRDFPHKDATSYVSPHLRFGTVSIRSLLANSLKRNKTYVSELIWREFFMQILFHFPRVINENFKVKYNGIEWRNNEAEFKKWCDGETGYPMVDAGMRQLNETGYMHNRVRMITAGFLCKHLLIDWKWGEAYFAQKLLDYELSSNNGNWQWAAGTGCDAAPYFRIFNPTTQLQKFDPKFNYVRQWIKDFDEFSYPNPMVDHKMARERAIETYKKGINN